MYKCLFELGLMVAMNESFAKLRNEIAEAKSAPTATVPSNMVQPKRKFYPQYSREQQISALARTIYGEGRGDGGEAGMRRVLDSIIARSGNNRDNFIGVVSEPYAYSCWNGMKPSDWNPKTFVIKDHSRSKESPELWEKAKELAAQAYDGGYKTAHDYAYYVTDELYQKTKGDKGRWYYGHEGVRDGKHRYFTSEEIDGGKSYGIPHRLTSEQVADTTLLSPKEKMAAKSKTGAAQKATASAPKTTTAAKTPTTAAKTPTTAAKADATATVADAGHSPSSDYTVKAGDNLTKIATSNGMSVADIKKLNPSLVNPDKIAVGQQLKIK